MFGIFKGFSEQGLIAHWPLDDGTGSTAKERKGRYDGTLFNMEEGDWVTGKIGGALEFDGVDEAVNSIAYSSLNALLNGIDTFTVAFWASATAFDTTSVAFSMGVLDSLQVTNTITIRPYDSTAANGLRVHHNNATALYSALGTAPADGTFHHFAHVSNGATDHRGFVDGVLEGTSTASRTMTSSFGEITIASRNGNTGHYGGKIDDVRIYNRALSDAEIAGLASLGV